MAIRPFQGIVPQVAGSAYVDEQAAVIGDVHIGDDSSIWPMAVLRGDVNRIRIGARSSIQDGTVGHVTHDHPGEPGGHPLVVGDDVTVGHNVTLHGCTIGNRCLVGMGSTVLDGAVLEEVVFLAAGSLVPPGKRLEGGYLWVGSPVKRARPLSEEEQQWLAYSAQHYSRLKDKYR
jgi:carbonic anhydrase/acetyltransferase-like protein (isoleucine patch superfamily)